MSPHGGDDLLVRLWRAKCREDRLKEFEKFLHDELFSTLKKQEGCLYAVAGQVPKGGETEMVIISEWKDMESLKGFTGPDWNKTIVNPRAAAYIKGEPQLEHFEVAERR